MIGETPRSVLCLTSIALLGLGAVGCPAEVDPATDGTGSESTGDGDGDPTAGDGDPGDGDGDPTSGDVPPAPPEGFALSPSPIKQFDFTWSPADDADLYRVFEDGAQLGRDLTGTSLSLTVPLHHMIGTSYVLQACNEFGCTDSAPLVVAGPLAQAIGYFKASNTEAGDQFGQAIALSGDGRTLAVGTPEEDDVANGSGAVYLFVRDGRDAWSPVAQIKAPNAGGGDKFGISVALSHDGSALAVGAYNEDSAAVGVDGDPDDNSASNSGAVYTFALDGFGGSTLDGYIKAQNPDNNDLFGIRVSLSDAGDVLAVAAIFEASNAVGVNGDDSDNSLDSSGAVYVFARGQGDPWAQAAYIKSPSPDPADSFGYRLALSGDGKTLAVGTEFEDSSAVGIDANPNDNLALSSGAVYVYAADDQGAWSHAAYVKASNTQAQDQFGSSVALSDDGGVLAVGALNEDGASIGVGGPRDDNGAPDSGAVYVFVRDEQGAWTQDAYVKASNASAGDSFTSVALSGDGGTLVVGAWREDSDGVGVDANESSDASNDAGAVYVFRRDDAIDQWTQTAYVKAPNPDADDQFGVQVALSEDGDTLAVSAPGESSGALDVSGDQNDDSASEAGAVYVY